MLDRELIQSAINLANLNAEKQNKCLKLLEILNNALINNQKDEFIGILKQNTDTFLSNIDYEYAGSLYFVEFKYIHEEKQTALDLDDFVHGIKVLNLIVEINKNIDEAFLVSQANSAMDNFVVLNEESFGERANELFAKLSNKNAHLQDVGEEKLKKRYLVSLMLAKQLKNSTNNNCITETTKNVSLSDSGHGTEVDMPFCGLLTHGEIQEAISQTNTDYEQECLAVVLINDSLSKDNVAHTLYLLKNSMPKDGKLVLIDQNAFMYHNELRKMKNMAHSKVLTIDDIRKGVKSSNIILENALNMTKTMILVNQISDTKRIEILNLIRDRSIGLKLNNDDECQELYYQTFKDLKRICKGHSIANHEWIWNKTAEDNDFYLNLKNANVYSWTLPNNYVESSTLITRTILKAI